MECAFADMCVRRQDKWNVCSQIGWYVYSQTRWNVCSQKRQMEYVLFFADMCVDRWYVCSHTRQMEYVFAHKTDGMCIRRQDGMCVRREDRWNVCTQTRQVECVHYRRLMNVCAYTNRRRHQQLDSNYRLQNDKITGEVCPVN